VDMILLLVGLVKQKIILNYFHFSLAFLQNVGIMGTNTKKGGKK